MSLILFSNSRLSTFLRVESTGAFYDSSIPTGQLEMPCYKGVDLSLNWRITDALNVTFNVDNSLDNDYQSSVGFSDNGIDGRVRLSYFI